MCNNNILHKIGRFCKTIETFDIYICAVFEWLAVRLVESTGLKKIKKFFIPLAVPLRMLRLIKGEKKPVEALRVASPKLPILFFLIFSYYAVYVCTCNLSDDSISYQTTFSCSQLRDRCIRIQTCLLQLYSQYTYHLDDDCNGYHRYENMPFKKGNGPHWNFQFHEKNIINKKIHFFS